LSTVGVRGFGSERSSFASILEYFLIALRDNVNESLPIWIVTCVGPSTFFFCSVVVFVLLDTVSELVTSEPKSDAVAILTIGSCWSFYASD
jgi:hypothetical protein